MRRDGALREYGSGQKNHWRRTIWNEVIRRMGDRRRTHPVLYLAGPDDKDRAVACSKGVSEHQMIAIDRYSPNIAKVRSSGGYGVVARDVLDVLWSWPKARDVGAVLLDYCCGLTAETTGVLDVFQREPLRQAVLMVNFMRGRDPYSNPVREAISRVLLPVPPITQANRAWQFVVFHALEFVAVVATQQPSVSLEDAPRWREYCAQKKTRSFIMCDEWLPLVARVAAGMDPMFVSYRSGSLVFDSVVLTPPWKSVKKHTPDLHLENLERIYAEPTIRHRIGAMHAVMSRRQKHGRDAMEATWRV